MKSKVRITGLVWLLVFLKKEQNDKMDTPDNTTEEMQEN